jgi:hypothetical protein
MYRAGLLRAVAEEISKYKLDLVGVQEVRWDGGGTEPSGEYAFFYGKGNICVIPPSCTGRAFHIVFTGASVGDCLKQYKLTI